MKKSLMGSVLILALILVSCSVPPVMVDQVSTDPTAVPITESTATVQLEEAIPAVPEPSQTAEVIIQPLEIAWIWMADARSGWAWSNENEQISQLLTTQDGGQTWKDVTPSDLGTVIGNEFLDAQTAWVSATDANGQWQLFGTLNGGRSWEILPAVEAIQYSDLKMFTPLEGVAINVSGAAGSAYYTIYETTDSGNQWSLVPLLPPDGSDGLPEGTVQVCNICGDILYYDPLRTLIAKGDMATESTGQVQVLYSADRGLNWTRTTLDLPAEFADGNNAPLQPKFQMQDGILPINVVKYDSNGNFVYSILLFYRTSDGGVTWQLQESRLNLQGVLPDPVHFASTNDIYTQCATGLCYSNDGGKSFTVNPLPMRLGDRPADMLVFEQYQFVSSTEGYAISKMGDDYQLWHTDNNGLVWTEILPEVIR